MSTQVQEVPKATRREWVAMMLDGMLQAVAGTDMTRHSEFIVAADAYSEQLRRYFDRRRRLRLQTQQLFRLLAQMVDIRPLGKRGHCKPPCV